MGIKSPVAVLGIVATHSNSGKTTLLEQLIPALSALGVAVSVIKHVHHKFDLDIPGKDSFRFRQAGARQVMVASDNRWALLQESQPENRAPDLDELIKQMDLSRVDLLLVEGMREQAVAKLEVSLDESGDRLLCWHDEEIIAVASKVELPGLPVPRLDIDDPSAVALFIRAWLEHQ
jgi:molybdopterin-guanine dinucleotide biosynthesis protein B